MTTDPVYVELGKHPDIELAVRALPRGTGWWMAEQRVILVHDGLTRRQRRCVVAHELEHALAGDDGCCGTRSDAWFTSKAETRASLRAARKLVSIERLADAIALYDDDDELVADHLDVDVATLDVRRATLQPGERHYLRRRMAAVTGEEVA